MSLKHTCLPFHHPSGENEPYFIRLRLQVASVFDLKFGSILVLGMSETICAI
jgi:hypothetical protein